MQPVFLVLAAIGGYLFGSIPFGLVLTRLAGLGDIRAIGSGNIGATNVLRTGRKDLAAATLLLDAGKAGIAAAVFAVLLGTTAGLVAGAAALIGHCFPVWLKFKGGKGVATYVGTMLVVFWPVGLVVIGTWLLMAAPGCSSGWLPSTWQGKPFLFPTKISGPLLGRSWGSLACSWGALGVLLGSSWPTLAAVGLLLASLGCSWGALEPLLACLGCSWGALERSWGALV